MNKKKRCVFCRDYFDAERMVKTPVGSFCCADHALQYSFRKTARKAKKAHSVEKKEFYASDRGKQLKAAQTAFNAFIRWRDKDEPCISCQRHHEGQYHAGHFRSIGAAGQLRFNQFNNNKQCSACNNYLSGNIGEYRINLIRKFGVDKVEWLESQNDPAKLSIDDIVSIRVYYTKLLKRLKS